MYDLASERGYPTPFANSPLLPLLLMSLAKTKHSPDISTDFKEAYDYVIIGSGAGGSVVASRLSELPCVSVLLLEAGKTSPLLTDVPAAALSFLKTDIDWDYRTVPQLFSGIGLVNKQVVWPRGKAVGGSTITNAMLYVRGNRKNYDDWEAEGATGWSYKDVLPYFKKIENNLNPDYDNDAYHARSGPVTVQKPPYNSDLKKAILEGAEELGYSINDPNGASQTGFYDLEGNIRNGQRCSVAKAYLVPAENRTNLDILANAFVTKILIRDRQAVGVQFDYEGRKREVRVRREVIVSAGTVNTPQLLMLSGIGPLLHLFRHGIPVVANLPVGYNLQDHCAGILGFEVDDGSASFENQLKDPANIQRYIDNRTGILASVAGVNVLAFLQNKIDFFPSGLPDHELYFLLGQPNVTLNQGLLPLLYQQYIAPHNDKFTFWCMSQILNPKSRGTISLKSSSPYDYPLINPNYYKDPRDLSDVVQGLKTCQSIIETTAMKNIGVKPFIPKPLGCNLITLIDEAFLACVAKTAPITIYHPVGTARMGNPSDSRTVVDPELRVKNVKGLRVVDASIMPIIPTGNTNFPTMMIAEKASDMIKKTITCS